LGRIPTTRLLTLLWALGITIFLLSHGSLTLIYLGRFIAGLGIGQTPVVGPVYLSEISPSSIRGLCVCLFTGFVYLGIVLAFWANYVCARVFKEEDGGRKERWMAPTGLHLFFAGVVLALMVWGLESPRWLIMKGRVDEARGVLSRLRGLREGDAYVGQEVEAIVRAWKEERRVVCGFTDSDLPSKSPSFLQRMRGFLLDAKATLLATCTRSNLYLVHLALASQLLSQWSGAGAITLYAPDLFELLGIHSSTTSLLITAIFGLIKLLASTICALFLVDVIGRRRSLLIGITFQALSLIYISSLLTALPWVVDHTSSHVPTNTQKGALRMAVFMLYLSGIG